MERLAQIATATTRPRPRSRRAGDGLRPAPPRVEARRPSSRRPTLVHLRYEVIQDVLVVRVLTPDLNDETTVAPLRAEIQSLFDTPCPAGWS